MRKHLSSSTLESTPTLCSFFETHVQQLGRVRSVQEEEDSHFDHQSLLLVQEVEQDVEKAVQHHDNGTCNTICSVIESERTHDEVEKTSGTEASKPVHLPEECSHANSDLTKDTNNHHNQYVCGRKVISKTGTPISAVRIAKECRKGCPNQRNHCPNAKDVMPWNILALRFPFPFWFGGRGFFRGFRVTHHYLSNKIKWCSETISSGRKYDKQQNATKYWGWEVIHTKDPTFPITFLSIFNTYHGTYNKKCPGQR
jgi:hypothetical protein